MLYIFKLIKTFLNSSQKEVVFIFSKIGYYLFAVLKHSIRILQFFRLVWVTVVLLYLLRSLTNCRAGAS